MPWTDKPGGNNSNGNGSNNGNGGRGPWGQPPRGNNGGGSDNQPPDLGEILNFGKEKMKRTMGNGGGNSGSGNSGGSSGPSGKLIGFALIAVLAIYVLMNSVLIVQQGERAVITTFGQYSKLAYPGLSFKFPSPIQEAYVVAVDNERTTNVGRASTESSMLTSDLNIVDVTITVNWIIKTGEEVGDGLPAAAKFLFNNDDTDSLVKAVAESALREVVGRNQLDPIISNGRAIVPVETRKLMQEMLDDYQSGIEIVRVNFQKADPPTQVIDSFRDVIDARSDAETLINVASREANEIIPQARGEAQKTILDAEAYEAKIVAEARGAASRFNDIYTEYAKAPEVTRQRMYLETMESVLGGDMDKIIIDDGAGTGAVPYLSLNELTKKSSN